MIESVTESTSTVTGRVKWFNSKAGFGFITVTEGDSAGNDIFVHHTSLSVTNDQYRYLLEGEYVEFTISEVASGKHNVQASNVKGIKGGKLMCETRYECRLLKNSYREDKTSVEEGEVDTPAVVPKQRRAPRETQSNASPQTQTKKVIKTNSTEWNVVEKKRKGKVAKKV